MAGNDDERIGRKIEVAFFVLKKKFKGLERARFDSEVRAALAAAAPGETSKMEDDELIPVLNDAVESVRKSYVMTLPRKRGGKQD